MKVRKDTADGGHPTIEIQLRQSEAEVLAIFLQGAGCITWPAKVEALRADLAQKLREQGVRRTQRG